MFNHPQNLPTREQKKALVDIVRHSQHPLDEKQLAALNTEIDNIVTLPELNNLSIIYQIKAVSATVKVKQMESYPGGKYRRDLEISKQNYVCWQAKVYEMKGMNREAASVHISPPLVAPGAARTGLKMVYSDFCSLCCTLSRQISRFRISNSRVDSCSGIFVVEFCMFPLV